jgi:hypothetical protein
MATQTLTKLMTGKDADDPGKVGPSTPEGSLRPSHPDIPGVDDHVGWNAPRTPPGVDTLDEGKVVTQEALDTITGPINNLAGAVEVLSELFRQQRDREAPRKHAYTLGTNPQIIHTGDRPYNAIVVEGAATQTLTVAWPGIGSYNKTLVPGWNVLNIPDGASLNIGSGTVGVYFVTSYTFLGNPL